MNARDGAAGRTVGAWNITYLLLYAEARGLARADAIERFAIDAAALDDVDGRVPLRVYERMWNELPGIVGDPDMPLHVIEHADAVDPPLNALTFLASPTLGEGLERMARWQRLTYDLADEPVSELVYDGDVAHIVVHHERAAVLPPTGAVIDACLGIAFIARMATQQDVAPVAARFRHPAPHNSAAYEAAFGCPVSFDEANDRLTLQAADLALPHPDASVVLLTIVERHADETLRSMPRGDDVIASVRRDIRHHLAEGEVAPAEVGDRLGLGARTLQRRLGEAGSSLRELVDEERRALALHHVQDPATTLVDIAFLLGFSDQSAFTRAFVRWTGEPPSSYRRRLRAGGAASQVP